MARTILPKSRFRRRRPHAGRGGGAITALGRARPGLDARSVARLQAAYYVSTALVPLTSRRTFEAVTGPKTDWWLVVTVSWLVAVIAAALERAARGGPPPSEIKLLGAGTAAALGTVDVVYVKRGRISRVYLLDSVVEYALLAGWTLAPPVGAEDRR